MDTTTVIGLISVLVSAVAAFLSYFFSRQAAQDARFQKELQSFALMQQYYADLRQWADDAVESITSAIFLYSQGRDRNASQAEWVETMRCISALIDRGRFFLPNVQADAHGQSKPVAYRGYRQHALDLLVSVYNILEQCCPTSESGEAAFSELWDIRKEFVSELQKTLDPSAQEDRLKDLIAQVGSARNNRRSDQVGIVRNPAR